MSFQKELSKTFDSDNNLIEFGNSHFQVFLKPIDSLVAWELEEFEIKTWHVFLKFNYEYDKDPTTFISYKYLKQKGDLKNKNNAITELKELFLILSNQNLISNKKDLDEETWAQYLEPVIQQKHLI